MRIIVKKAGFTTWHRTRGIWVFKKRGNNAWFIGFGPSKPKFKPTKKELL